jgi:alanine dehydrogenase
MLQLDAVALAACLDRATLIDELDNAFRRPFSVPTRQRYQLQPVSKGQTGGTLLLMPAWNTGGSLGVKIVTVFPDNALRGLPAVCASYLLLDAINGRPRAMLDGGELTLRRTGAASALASRHLSLPDSSRLLMVGTGELAPHLIASHALVRPIREVRIWGRRVGRAQALAASLAKADLSVEFTEDLQSATGWADIVSCATLSKQPLILGAWLRPGQHLDLVGAFTPGPALSVNRVKSSVPSRGVSSIGQPFAANCPILVPVNSSGRLDTPLRFSRVSAPPLRTWSQRSWRSVPANLGRSARLVVSRTTASTGPSPQAT